MAASIRGPKVSSGPRYSGLGSRQMTSIPIFVVWQTGFFESAGDIIKIGIEKLGIAPERVEGWVVDKLKDVKDRAFEVFARDFGVKAIWENMKSRAAGASRPGLHSGGGLRRL